MDVGVEEAIGVWVRNGVWALVAVAVDVRVLLGAGVGEAGRVGVSAG